MTEPQVNGHVPSGTHHASPQPIKTDILIIGSGVAGGSLAAFLAYYGMTGLVVTQDSSQADTPRAHITNVAAIDALRDIGLDQEAYRLGTTGDCMIHTRWSNTFAGEEYARIYSWGNDPKRKGDYRAASPSVPLDLPQTLLEPIMTQYATVNGFKLRFNTSFVSFVDDPKHGVTTTLLDSVTGQSFQVQSKYLFGADGARSPIVRQLDIPLVRKPGQGFAVNVLFRAEMAHLMENRMGNLHWVLKLDEEDPDFAWIGCMRMVKPWHEWICVIFPAPTAERVVRPHADYLKRVKQLIGDDSIDVEIIGVSTWTINEIAAEYYSVGNVFCLGDAVHRHPPNHGLGSNTCIQDSHNLAWKVAYVEKGLAGKELLQSYSLERQPVGLHVVMMANASLRNHKIIWDVLGKTEPSVAGRKKILDELAAATAAGRERRKQLQIALRAIDREEHGLGIEMNQRYESKAVYQADQGPWPVFDTDDLEYYHPTTYPGARLPHAWINTATPSKRISTIDLAGKGRFALITGIGGQRWKDAAKALSDALKVPLAAYSIGWRQDYEDVYLTWSKLRGVDESGCVLVRPDYFVAWRAPVWEDGSPEKLGTVLKSVLSLE